MELTKKQAEGLLISIDRYKAGKKYTVISGYAGSGKSTLVRFIINALDVDEDKVCYCAFTGKAAEVLRKKGNKNVCTLHKLLYESIPKPDGTFFRRPKPFIDYKIVIVDEVSMAPKQLMELLFTHNVFIIALGDPFQLPPVDKNQDNGLLNNPDVFLDEIMRQALDSEIIRLSMQVRNRESFDYFTGHDAIVMPKKDLNTGVLKWADQILVGTNATRVAINNQMRDLMGRGNKPENGDKVICLRNYWDNLATNDDPLVNGTIGYISDVYETYNKTPNWAGGEIIKVLEAKFTSDSDADFGLLQMDEKQILTGERCLDFRKIYKLTSNWRTAHLVPMEFTYGYAITYWKAQGSEWDNVVVLEESFPYDAETHARAMYTAITRASNKLVWVR